MRVALVNPPWSFEGSIYFGCREPHLPLEFGYAKALLEAAGHEALLIDAQLDDIRASDVRKRLESFEPHMTVVTTAPSYLFWRCAPPELRVPQQLVAAVRESAGTIVVVGPHASTTPRATLRKLGAHVAVLGECEEVVTNLASTPRARWGEVESIAWVDGTQVRIQGKSAACDLTKLPALRWPKENLARHAHHHHRFDRKPKRPGAEVESSRGCPQHGTFSAREELRDAFRQRPLRVVLAEIDGLLAQGVEYVYFIDEIFLPNRELLEGLCERDLAFGVQIRVDNWNEETLDLLGRAGCVSVEAGVESIAPEGRALWAKSSRASTERLTELLVHAKQNIPFVQANLIEARTDDADEVSRWRRHLHEHGVWAEEPMPMFPYPGSPEYALRWGPPDDDAWERAHAHYLLHYRIFGDVQDSLPRHLSLSQLELPDAGR
jgi:B12-binding domain/radical SAM domain protein of rhizo-twelve system